VEWLERKGESAGISDFWIFGNLRFPSWFLKLISTVTVDWSLRGFFSGSSKVDACPSSCVRNL
jgi:hypothetical protein